MAQRSAGPSKEILEAALHGLETQRQRLDEQIAEVRSLMGQRSPGRPSKQTGGSSSQAPQRGAATARKKRVLSPEARKRIAAAQKKRWAAFRKTQ